VQSSTSATVDTQPNHRTSSPVTSLLAQQLNNNNNSAAATSTTLDGSGSSDLSSVLTQVRREPASA
jgi:hypothetical protein